MFLFHYKHHFFTNIVTFDRMRTLNMSQHCYVNCTVKMVKYAIILGVRCASQRPVSCLKPWLALAPASQSQASQAGGIRWRANLPRLRYHSSLDAMPCRAIIFLRRCRNGRLFNNIQSNICLTNFMFDVFCIKFYL